VRIAAPRPFTNLEGQDIYLCPTPRSKPGCYGWPYRQLAAAATVTSATQYTLIMSTSNNVMTKTQNLISVRKKLCESALWQSNVIGTRAVVCQG